MKKYRSNTFQINHIFTFWSLISLIVVSVFLYGYFVNVTILHTAKRQEVEDSIIDKKTVVSQLELSLIESSRNLTKEYAYDLGFSPVGSLTFIERDIVASLSLNEI